MSTFETLKRSCQRLAKQKYLYFLQLRCGQNKESQRVLKVYIKQNFTLKSTKPLTVCFSGFCNINKSLTDSSMMTNVSLPFKASFNQITDSIFIHITTEHPSFASTTSINGFSDRYDWPFWKTNSPRKCASTPTAPSFPHCAYLSVEAYTISNWPDLAFRVPLIEWLWLLSVAALPTCQKRQLFKTPTNRNRYKKYHI